MPGVKSICRTIRLALIDMRVACRYSSSRCAPAVFENPNKEQSEAAAAILLDISSKVF
jgi:hypothetical protein